MKIKRMVVEFWDCHRALGTWRGMSGKIFNSYSYF